MKKVLASNDVVLLLALLFIVSLSFYSVSSVHADGGAPNLAYVSGTATGISVIDVGQSKVTRTLSVPGDPHTILLSADGRLLYATQPTLEQVSIIAALTGHTLCSTHVPGAPTLLSLDQNTNTLYTAGNEANNITAIDATTCAVRHIYAVANPVYGLALGILPGNGTVLWVADTSTVSIFNTQSTQLLGTIAIAGGPRYLTVPQLSPIAYVTTQQGSVAAIDFQTHRVLPLITSGTFGPMDYDALTGAVYVPDLKHNVIDVLNPIDSGTTTLPTEPERVIQLATSPTSIAITNDGLLGFVAMQGGKVAMLDLLGRHIVYALAVGGTPHFIITGLYPPTTNTPTPTASQSSPPPPAQTSLSPTKLIIIALFTLAFLLFVTLCILFLRLRGSRGPGSR